MSRGWITLHNLVLEARVGVLAHEHERPQPVRVHLRLAADLSRCVRTDDLADTLDYAAVASALREAVEGRRWNLIETLAWDLAGLLLDRFGVSEVRLRLEKPEALGGMGVPGVALRRAR